jgi:hypothetical protein
MRVRLKRRNKGLRVWRREEGSRKVKVRRGVSIMFRRE